MKQNEKIWVIGLIIVTIILGGILIAKNSKKQDTSENQEEIIEEFVEVLEDGTKLNKSDKLSETKMIDGLEISNFQLTEKDNVSVLLGTITNNTNETKGDYPVAIKVIDKKGNEIITVGGYIGELKPGQSMQLNCSASFDYANAYDFEITRK